MIPTIDVFQKEWAFTSSDSSRPIIRTGCFGPCHVVTFSGGKYSALAHIDENTSIGSIKNIFDRFKTFSIPPENIKAVIMGGWKSDRESRLLGKEILSFVLRNGVKDINVSQMRRKEELGLSDYFQVLSPEATVKYYFLGACINATTGKTFIVNKEDIRLSEEQLKRSDTMNPDIVYSLKEVIEKKSKETSHQPTKAD